MYPKNPGGDYGGDDMYMINSGERIPVRGGGWLYTSSAGVSEVYLSVVRGYRVGYVGRRSAFVGSLEEG